jgi:hypothetical protein
MGSRSKDGGVAGAWLAGLFIRGLRKTAAVSFHEVLFIEFKTSCSWTKLWRMVFDYLDTTRPQRLTLPE